MVVIQAVETVAGLWVANSHRPGSQSVFEASRGGGGRLSGTLRTPLTQRPKAQPPTGRLRPPSVDCNYHHRRRPSS